jgi:hypothetical protein
MTQKIKSLFAKSVTVFIFCLLLSGCVIYPEDGGFEGFPQKVRVAFLSNAALSFKGPPEIVGLNLDPDYSDYTSHYTGSPKTFLLSYTEAGKEDFNTYAKYLVGVLGTYYDTSQADYSCYAWLSGRVGIELGFSNQWVSSSATGLSVSAVPPHSLYLLIIIY